MGSSDVPSPSTSATCLKTEGYNTFQIQSTTVKPVQDGATVNNESAFQGLREVFQILLTQIFDYESYIDF